MPLIHRLVGTGIVALVFMFLLTPWCASAQNDCNEEDVRRNYTLYAEDFKNGNYESALPYLKWIINCAPDFGTNTDRNFRRLVETYEGIGIAQEDPQQRVAYLDSALAFFDAAPAAILAAGIELDAFKWTFNKGYFIQSHVTDLPHARDAIGGIYANAYRIDPTRLEPFYIDFIIRDLVKQGQDTDALVFIATVESDRPGETDLAATLNTWRGKLITSPEDRIAFLKSQLVREPHDVGSNQELLELYLNEGYREEAYDLISAWIEEDPQVHLFIQAGTMRLEDGFEEDAIALFEKALRTEKSTERLGEIHYNLGIALQQIGKLEQARTHFKKSARTSKESIDALIALGDLLVAAVHTCETYDRKDRAVYWLAADYYERASTSAPNRERQQMAQKRIKDIQPHFPSTDEKFFEQWAEGERYTVDYGCYDWINESTTVK